MGRSNDGIRYLWEDKKRIFGLPVSFTTYRLSHDRLFMEQGLLNIREEEILLYKVQDLHLSMTLGQRFFGVGTIVVISSDQSSPKLKIQDIAEPRRVKELIHKEVEREKDKRQLRTFEMTSGHGSGRNVEARF